jgi:O-methyltransferase
MLSQVKRLAQDFVGMFGYQFTRVSASPGYSAPVEMNEQDIELVQWVHREQLSMATFAGLFSTVAAAKYVAENQIDGDFVECGVWRGGNSIIAAEIFRRYQLDKKVFLFDTFKGMTEPTQDDRSLVDNEPALKEYIRQQEETHNSWCFAPLGEVQSNFRKRNLLDANVVFVEGPVEDTLRQSGVPPKRISFLRLDTDWYESTKVELEILYPLVPQGGVVVIDDYGCWSGSKKATDEYFSDGKARPFFHVTDETRRIGIKL